MTTISLPGIQKTLTLPEPPDMLYQPNSLNPVTLDKLEPMDVVLLGMALARQTIRRWREISTMGLSESEAALFDAVPIVHEAVVERCARAMAASATTDAWASLDPQNRAACTTGTRVAIETFLEELNHG